MLGSPNAADTTAYIHDSTVTSAGGLTVSATSTEAISATVTNAATAAVEPSAGSSSYSASAVLTDNQILTDVTAYIDNTGAVTSDPVKATNAVTVKAANSASITASSSITALGTQAAAGPANDYANLASASYKYTNLSGTEDLNFGDQVAVEQTNGTIIVYRFMGDSDEGKGIDLGALTGATASMAYTESGVLEAAVGRPAQRGGQSPVRQSEVGSFDQRNGHAEFGVQLRESLPPVRLQQRAKLDRELRLQLDGDGRQRRGRFDRQRHHLGD